MPCCSTLQMSMSAMWKMADVLTSAQTPKVVIAAPAQTPSWHWRQMVAIVLVSSQMTSFWAWNYYNWRKVEFTFNRNALFPYMTVSIINSIIVRFSQLPVFLLSATKMTCQSHYQRPSSSVWAVNMSLSETSNVLPRKLKPTSPLKLH